ncbi:MAG: glycosyltransferase family 4 protein [Flavobacteriia bacterium]|jgi:glycosyltransferase involved in cell wall biosynthesis
MATYIISDVKKAVFFEHTALLLRQRGVELNFILINSKNTSLDFFLLKNNFEVNYIQVKSLTKSFIPILALSKILAKRKTKIIHCHLGNANWVGLWAGFLSGVKQRIFTRHAGEPLNYNLKEKIIDQIQNRLSTDIVSISLNITDILKSQGVPESKIKLIHHGFDIDRFQNVDEEEVDRIRAQYNPLNCYPVVGVIARWMEWKGIQYIIPAFEKLLKDFPNAKLMLFNASDNGDYSSDLNEMLHKLPKDKYQKVSFEENIYDLYQLFDLYVHVPVNPQCEAFGQTYIEALAAGIPSIFTLSGIAREFITDKNAIIVPFRDQSSIFEAMKFTLYHKEITKTKVIQGKQDVSVNFVLEKYIEKLMQLYILQNK